MDEEKEKDQEINKGLTDTALNDGENTDEQKKPLAEETNEPEEPSELDEPEEVVESPRKKTSIEDVSLNVHFEMKRIKSSLGELKNYEPGYVFDFTVDADSIYLTVNGQVIGKGQLVELADKVGVRLTEIYK